jgi:hypothetical protein
VSQILQNIRDNGNQSLREGDLEQTLRGINMKISEAKTLSDKTRSELAYNLDLGFNLTDASSSNQRVGVLTVDKLLPLVSKMVKEVDTHIECAWNSIDREGALDYPGFDS